MHAHHLLSPGNQIRQHGGRFVFRHLSLVMRSKYALAHGLSYCWLDAVLLGVSDMMRWLLRVISDDNNYILDADATQSEISLIAGIIMWQAARHTSARPSEPCLGSWRWPPG